VQGTRQPDPDSRVHQYFGHRAGVLLFGVSEEPPRRLRVDELPDRSGGALQLVDECPEGQPPMAVL
jgi:hypothetical protein